MERHVTLTPVLILSHSPVELHVTLTPVLILSHLPVERHVTLTLVLILSHLPVERHVALTPGLIPVVAGGGLDLLARAGRGLDASSVASISVHVLGGRTCCLEIKATQPHSCRQFYGCVTYRACVSQYRIGGSPAFPSRRTQCTAAGSEGYKAGNASEVG